MKNILTNFFLSKIQSKEIPLKNPRRKEKVFFYAPPLAGLRRNYSALRIFLRSPDVTSGRSRIVLPSSMKIIKEKASKNFLQGRRRKKALRLFLREIEKNLESCHVMQQQGILSLFAEKNMLPADESFKDYVLVIRDFNESFKDAQNYDRWYCENTERMTRENAQILHDKKVILDEKFKQLFPIISAAKTNMENQLKRIERRKETTAPCS